MKLLVCCIIITANISNIGKASLDSFIPANTNVLFEDITKKSDKSCQRICKFNVKPRRCFYQFKIEPAILDDGKPVLSINGMSPGPPINVCLHDIIVVEVENKIPGQDIAIHWHGLEQKGMPYMDGVPMISQCPVTYGSIYKYAFTASSPGTFFYHSDSVSHQSDGIYGPLIINQPQPLELHSSLYDYDRSQENTLIISARFDELLTGNLEDVRRMKPGYIAINGEENSSKIFVMSGYTYRIRLINGIAVECPIVAQIENHEMMIIATDGRPVKPVVSRKVLMYPGERMDLVVRASQETGGYWIQVTGRGACAGLKAYSMFLYSGFNYTSMLQEGHKFVNLETRTVSQAIYGQLLESPYDFSYNSADVKSVYLGIDSNSTDFDERDVDFTYTSDALPKKSFFPAQLSLQNTRIVQINGKSFLYPSTPMLLQPRDKPSVDPVCFVGEEVEVPDLQCVQVLNAREGEVLELALVNEGIGSNESYTFHMHGYGMQVLATWQHPEKISISKEEFQRMDNEGKIKRNLHNPVLKDTVTVPNKGFTIVRIRPDHGGSWILECRSCSLYSLPTAVVLNVPQFIPKAVTESLPKCGTYKPPDVLLN